MSSKATAFVIADDPAYQPWLQAALGSSVDCSFTRPMDAADLLGRLERAGKVDLLFCDFEDYNAAERALLVEAVAERFPDLPVVGMGSSEDAATVLTAMRSGARDFFVLRRDDSKLAIQVGKLLRRAGAAAQVAVAANVGQGKLFSVVGAQPYEAIACLSTHLAAGAGAIFLNLSPTYSLIDAVADVHRCDQTLVDTAFTRHSSGVYLLSLPEDGIGRPALPAEDFGRLLGVLRSLFQVVVVALDGQSGTPFLRGAISQSDRVLVLTDQSILKSRQTKYLLRALRLEDVSLDRAGLVIDNYRRRLGLEPANLAELFDLSLLATLTTEGFNRIQAMNSGESLFSIAPKDPYCDAVRKLAGALLVGAAAPVEAASGGLLGRLFR
jgi:pilus assembly protein CpaE